MTHNVWYHDSTSSTSKRYIELPTCTVAQEGTRISIGTSGTDIQIKASSSAKLRWTSNTKSSTAVYGIGAEVDWVHWIQVGYCWTRCDAGNW
jgi:hypothetical protein